MLNNFFEKLKFNKIIYVIINNFKLFVFFVFLIIIVIGVYFLSKIDTENILKKDNDENLSSGKITYNTYSTGDKIKQISNFCLYNWCYNEFNKNINNKQKFWEFIEEKGYNKYLIKNNVYKKVLEKQYLHKEDCFNYNKKDFKNERQCLNSIGFLKNNKLDKLYKKKSFSFLSKTGSILKYSDYKNVYNFTGEIKGDKNLKNIINKYIKNKNDDLLNIINKYNNFITNNQDKIDNKYIKRYKYLLKNIFNIENNKKEILIKDFIKNNYKVDYNLINKILYNKNNTRENFSHFFKLNKILRKQNQDNNYIYIILDIRKIYYEILNIKNNIIDNQRINLK